VLAEIPTADLVVTTGLDRAESVSLMAALDARSAADPASTVDVHPAHLAVVAGGWPPATEGGPRPAFYDAVAAVAGPMYAAEPDGDGRIPPARAAGDLAARLPDGGVVVAPPGPTGFWVGRTFPTSVGGSVLVPTGDPPGTAVAAAVLAARSGRPATLVVTVDDPVPEVVALARDEDLPLAVEVWSEDGSTAVAGATVVGVDWSALDRLVEVAGLPDEAIWPS
jgi:hypothetical protein